MIEARTQSPFQATADLMRAWTFAANATALQTMTFWTRMLRSPLAGVPATPAEPVRYASDAADAEALCTDTPHPATEETADKPADTETPAEPAYSSYRSSSGHAVAQVIVYRRRATSPPPRRAVAT